jgi:diaminopimelate epimerase
MLPFTKVQGLGNDFVVVDLRADADSREALEVQNPEIVRRVCDRHFGVGADGILAILPPSPGVEGDARMRVLNADGSEAEMCGNGIRCVARILYESDPALRRPVLRIDTGAGLLACEMNVAAGQVESVTVEMGRPRYAREEIPLLPGGAGRALREPITALDRTFRFTAVSMGNPHAVIFLDGDESLRALAEKYGPVLEVAPTFPRRTNVELARVRGAEIDLVVWERGCGITLACGTGTCATVAAAALEERLPRGREVPVHLPGGTLFVTVAPDDSGVRMRGSATSVFTSALDLAAFAAALAR